jgi:hypothetical protein
VSAGRGAAPVLGLALALLLMPAGTAGAAPTSSGASPTPVNGTAAAGAASEGKTAPSGPPLTSPLDASGAEDTAGVPSLEGDQLVENGLSSPLCDSAKALALSNAAQSNCQTSGFVGAPAPTNNYDLDVNIDAGTLGIGNGQLLSVIQDVFVAPVWEGLVWLVHALVVMLQWCYTLELLGGSMTSGLRSSLRQAQTSFTEPWLALALAAASVLAFYNGLIRRRVGETLGQALLTIAMMAVGLWLIADPLGTVGAVGQFANQASLGTLGAVAQGTTANAPRTLGDSMRALFAGAIEVPWCYLEFGDVRWCSDPAMLEPRLRRAASSIVASEQAKLDCQPSLTHPLCRSSGKSSAPALERTSELLREADTNGSLFLAFPANGPERNSTKGSGSLLHVLCQSENDSKCEGITAAQAEFRSDGGTFPRMLGVVLIAIGVLGMAMLFGLIAIHLLASALLSLFMLLLAPFVVLAPALGDAGRAVFSGWLTRLLGAVCSKLIFSFVLGALLTMQRMLTSLQPLGWWTQWLLISAFWWFVFLKRHKALEFVRSGGRAPLVSTRHTFGQRIRGARQAKQDLAHPVRWAKDKLLSPLPEDEELDKPELKRREPGRRAPGPTVPGQPQAGGTDQSTGPARRQEGGTDEQPGQEEPAERSEYAGTVKRLGRDGRQTAQAGEGAVAAEPRIAGRRDQASSAAPGGAGSSRRDGGDKEKPTRLERVARLAAYASDPEYDEAAWLANARRRPASQPPLDQPRSPAQQGQQSSPRAATESAGTSPSNPARAASDLRGSNSQDTRMRTSREIMDDAREVAAGRKRQLGIESLAEEELEP